MPKYNSAETEKVFNSAEKIDDFLALLPFG